MMKWIGLTGGIATGKSTVAEFIKQSGYPVINADDVAHQALSPTGPIFHDIVKAFGRDILTAAGDIDRRALGARIFKDEAQRLKLESLIHPYVRRQVKSRRDDLEKQGQKLAFYDVPLLYEKNMQDEFDRVIVVACSEKLQMDRLLQRSALSPIEARDRIRSQLPLAEKIARADIVIENDSTLEALLAATKAVLQKLT